MLEHEPQETPAAQIPAAQRRVSAEELTRAVSALEDAKAAERVAGVAPIGQVVEELGLDSTPEEIWAQVQKQRAQAKKQADETQAEAEAAQSAQIFTAQSAILPRRRRWRGRLWIIFGIGMAAYGAWQGNLITPPGAASSHITTSGQTITIHGDLGTQTIPVQGKDVIISGAMNNITLQGRAQSVTVTGDIDTVRGDAPQRSVVTGDGDNVQWTDSGKSPDAR